MSELKKKIECQRKSVGNTNRKQNMEVVSTHNALRADILNTVQPALINFVYGNILFEQSCHLIIGFWLSIFSKTMLFHFILFCFLLYQLSRTFSTSKGSILITSSKEVTENVYDL